MSGTGAAAAQLQCLPWSSQGVPAPRTRPCHRSGADPLPLELAHIPEDFWLIDGREVVAMHYEPDGQFRAAEILPTQQVAKHCKAAEVAWELGEDFLVWWNQHPHHHRCAYRVS
jgi:hypothetical protein